LEIRDTISTFPTLLLRRCLTPLRVCETNQCVCERSKPALLKSVWKCELLEFDCFCRLAMRGLHYGQELVSTNRPDTFAQTKPPTTTILLAISRRTIQFPWPAFRPAMLDEQLCHPAQSAKPQRTAHRDQMSVSALAIWHKPRNRTGHLRRSDRPEDASRGSAMSNWCRSVHPDRHRSRLHRCTACTGHCDGIGAEGGTGIGGRHVRLAAASEDSSADEGKDEQ
jgi:hypothetical protein